LPGIVARTQAEATERARLAPDKMTRGRL